LTEIFKQIWRLGNKEIKLIKNYKLKESGKTNGT